MHQQIFQHEEHVRRQATEAERAQRLERAFIRTNSAQRRARRRRGPLSWLLRTVGVMLVRVGTQLADDPLESTTPLLGGGSFSRN